MTPIYLRNLPPPIEKFNHTEFLSFIASYVKPERYLELGIRCGSNFREISKHCKECIGVDITSYGGPMFSNMTFHQMSTDLYFKNIHSSEMFDMVFIDADHSHEQSLRDFCNVKDWVIPDGFIFLHDTYPCDPVYLEKSVCNDVYKTALYIKLHYHDFEVLTLPFQPGVTIIKKMKSNKQLLWI